MAQRSSPILPITSGIGAVSPVNVGGPGSAEEAFRNQHGVLQRLLSGIGSGNNVSLEDLARSQFRDRQDLMTGLEPAGGKYSSVDITGQSNQILPPGFSSTDLSPTPGTNIGLSEVSVLGPPDLSTSFPITVPDPERPTGLLGDLLLGKMRARGQGLDPDIGPGGLDFDMPSVEAFKALMNYDSRKDVMSREGMDEMSFRSKNQSDSYLSGEEEATEASGESATGERQGPTTSDPYAIQDKIGQSTGLGETQTTETQTTEQKKSNLYAGLLKESLDNYNMLRDNAPSDAKTMEEYKKEFSDATGIDITGQPDNSAALTAFGLALMQNKAGKGFDVGELLSETGKAGEKALPLMAQARKEAREAQIAAGQYALGASKEDRLARAKSLDEATKYLVGRRDKILDDQRARIEAMDDFEKKRLATIELETLKANFEAEIEWQKTLTEANEPNFKVGNVKDWEPLGNTMPVKITIGIKEKDGRPVFLFPAEQAETLGQALADVTDGMNSLDSLRDKIIKASTTDAGKIAGISGQKAYEVYQQWAASLGYDGGKVPQFDKDGKFTGELKREMPIQEADAIRQRLIAQFKRFLTQETGNGISNVDVQNIETLLGQINFLTDPQGALNRLEEVRAIFKASESKITGALKKFDNKDRYQTPEEYNLARQAISDGINRAFYKKGNISGGVESTFNFTVDDDGNQVYDFTQ